MTHEDKEFLRELQNELKTQPTDFQAAPRFWGVAEIRRFPTDEEHSDTACVFDFHQGITYSQDEFVEMLEEGWDEVEHEIFEKEDLHEMSIDGLVELAEDDFGWTQYEVQYYLEEQIVTDKTGCFLTKRACQRHIDLNGYHYNQAQTYAMTAWRNPEFERLLKILTEINIDDIKEE